MIVILWLNFSCWYIGGYCIPLYPRSPWYTLRKSRSRIFHCSCWKNPHFPCVHHIIYEIISPKNQVRGYNSQGSPNDLPKDLPKNPSPLGPKVGISFSTCPSTSVTSCAARARRRSSLSARRAPGEASGSCFRGTTFFDQFPAEFLQGIATSL